MSKLLGLNGPLSLLSIQVQFNQTEVSKTWLEKSANQWVLKNSMQML